MELFYRLYEEDYLQHELYCATKSRSVIESRKRSRFSIVVFLVIASVLFLSGNHYLLAMYLFVAAIIVYLLYPAVLRKQYEKHYRNLIKETYPDKKDEKSSVELTEYGITIKNPYSEYKVSWIEVNRVVEIGQYFFIGIGPSNIIIPKTKVGKRC